MSLRPFRLPRLAPLAALLALAGCGSDQPQFAPPCPRLSLLQDASDIVRFAGAAGAAKDPRTITYAARITAVPAHCEAAGTNEVRAVMHIVAQVRRGPAATGDTVAIPYFIAITQDGRVLDELNYTLGAKFAGNVDVVTAQGGTIDFSVPVTPAVSAAAYHLYVGFRLSPDELAYNRQAAPQ